MSFGSANLTGFKALLTDSKKLMAIECDKLTDKVLY